MCPTNPQNDLRWRSDNEPFSRTASRIDSITRSGGRKFLPTQVDGNVRAEIAKRLKVGRNI
jgi:hypothetical protein